MRTSPRANSAGLVRILSRCKWHKEALRSSSDIIWIDAYGVSMLALLSLLVIRFSDGAAPRQASTPPASRQQTLPRHRYPGAGLRGACDRRLSGE
jgi:hypothetical protein